MDCISCDAPHNNFGGIMTTLGYVCYECVQWIHRVAYETRALAPRELQKVLQDIDSTE